jgi:hypothetical protein
MMFATVINVAAIEVGFYFAANEGSLKIINLDSWFRENV